MHVHTIQPESIPSKKLRLIGPGIRIHSDSRARVVGYNEFVLMLSKIGFQYRRSDPKVCECHGKYLGQCRVRDSEVGIRGSVNQRWLCADLLFLLKRD